MRTTKLKLWNPQNSEIILEVTVVSCALATSTFATVQVSKVVNFSDPKSPKIQMTILEECYAIPQLLSDSGGPTECGTDAKNHDRSHLCCVLTEEMTGNCLQIVLTTIHLGEISETS